MQGSERFDCEFDGERKFTLVFENAVSHIHSDTFRVFGLSD